MSERYEIVEGGKAIKCSTCGLTSWYSDDVKHRYCGKCNVFHDDPLPTSPQTPTSSGVEA